MRGTPNPLRHVPAGAVPSRLGGDRLLDLVRVMARLRAPDGCPWDLEQTHRSLRRHLLDEAYEVLDAIDSGDPAKLRDELGDLLLQSVFHAQMAADAGEFDIDDVAESIVAKLIRRHPHVFGDVQADTPEEVYGNWEKIKAEERGPSRESDRVDADLSRSLPALLAAQKVQRRAAGRGFDWSAISGAVENVREELAELEEAARAVEGQDPEGDAKDALEGEVGDVLFAVGALARKLGVDAESALRGTIDRFADRFESMEAAAASEGVELQALGEDELRRRFRAGRDA